jgi:glucose/arabinose dehydrogenase
MKLAWILGGLGALTLGVAASCSDETTSDNGTAGNGGNGNTGGSAGEGPGGSAGNGGGTAGEGGTSNDPVPTNHNCDTPPGGALPALTLETVVEGFERPLLAIAPRGDADRLFVIEQRGYIRLFKDGMTTTFLDISAKVGDQDEIGNEAGLLGLAFHPGFMNNGRFFVHYSNTVGDTVISEYKVSADNPDVADPEPVIEPLYFADQPFANHNGGQLVFSPIDFFLYLGLGDGGSGGDPGNRAQNINEPLGKILRFDVDGMAPYEAPEGNLPGGLPEIWDFGMRNPWRFTFDACNGDMYIGDVGQDLFEEIDYEAAGDGNRNYGWRLKEGDDCFNPSNNCEDGVTLTDPVVVEPQTNNPCDSIVGGYVYRGQAIPALRGTYFYSDTCLAYIKAFTIAGGQATNEIDLSDQLEAPGAVYSFGEDNDGEIYVVAGGGVYRIVAE